MKEKNTWILIASRKRGKNQSRLVKLFPISGHDQIVDILTKALHPTNFSRLVSKLVLFKYFLALDSGRVLQLWVCIETNLKSY